MHAFYKNKYAYISTATTTQVVTGACTLRKIIISTTVASIIQIIDGTAGSTTNVAEFQASAGVATYDFDISLQAGLRIITAGATKMTVVYNNS